MIEYAQTPETRFFLCRQCRAHIALTENYIFTVCSLSPSLSPLHWFLYCDCKLMTELSYWENWMPLLLKLFRFRWFNCLVTRAFHHVIGLDHFNFAEDWTWSLHYIFIIFTDSWFFKDHLNCTKAWQRWICDCFELLPWIKLQKKNLFFWS